MPPQKSFMENAYYVPLSVIYYALAALLALMIYGVIGSIYIMGLDFYNAIYFTVITIATVGYGDITPLTVTP
ncbi:MULTISPECIES: ion channel [Methanothermobacter]|uniref:Ion channel n=1 Tax=Methanothermobacter wolfeii TaxID=145261 RepID=A0A9E7RSU9_METWO|nr:MULTISPECIES: ion channel [Methanothermobacter]UXH31578.1 ion channel [Methanothermobacter wolfeii]